MKVKRNQDIRNIMFANYVSQKELGEVLGVTQKTISVMLSKNPLSDADRARLMDGIEKVKNDR